MINIPFAKVDCAGNELAYVTEVLKSGWLTTAGKCLEFEKRFASAVGASHACALNSATAALHLAVEAIGIGPGDKVLVPSMTFTASAEIIRYLGADPVFLDVDYATRLVTPEIVQAALDQHRDVKALVVVHFGGQAAQMLDAESRPGIVSVCRNRGVKILEDAAHAFPTRHQGRMVGAFGDATCFSFYANKTITTGEGGMLTTEDEAVYRRVKTMRLHGISRDIWDRFTSAGAAWEYDVVAPGFKYNMPDVNAAIGLAQLERAEEFRQARERCCRFYDHALADIACLDLPERTGAYEDHSWHLYPIVIGPDAPVDRNLFIDRMAHAGIGTSVHYKPLHRMTYYRERYHLDPAHWPNTERIWKGTVSLPVYPGLTPAELEYICATVHRLLMPSPNGR
jgi:dTDP-4-amino-4,6-dideoxygalactose transaminase